MLRVVTSNTLYLVAKYTPEDLFFDRIVRKLIEQDILNMSVQFPLPHEIAQYIGPLHTIEYPHGAGYIAIPFE